MQRVRDGRDKNQGGANQVNSAAKSQKQVGPATPKPRRTRLRRVIPRLASRGEAARLPGRGKDDVGNRCVDVSQGQVEGEHAEGVAQVDEGTGS